MNVVIRKRRKIIPFFEERRMEKIMGDYEG